MSSTFATRHAAVYRELEAVADEADVVLYENSTEGILRAVRADYRGKPSAPFCSLGRDRSVRTGAGIEQL